MEMRVAVLAGLLSFVSCALCGYGAKQRNSKWLVGLAVLLGIMSLACWGYVALVVFLVMNWPSF